MNDKCLFLPEVYDLVIGDKFELFYRGIIKLFNPYQYYIHLECEKGKAYPRYFTYTPKDGEEGEYLLTITLLNEEQIIAKETTKLIIHKASRSIRPLNVLCIGDSMTYNGVWPSFGYSLYNKSIQKNNINMIGTCIKDGIGYEGYGSWNFKTYCSSDYVTADSAVWVHTKNDLSEEAQHSVWINGKLNWILETITPTRLKFKRGDLNHTINPKIENVFKPLNSDYDDIVITSYEFEKGNPFWNNKENKNDFINYCEKNKFSCIDLVYILLSWNGLSTPYCKDFPEQDKYAKELIRTIHHDYKDAKICLIGLQIPSINGGITENYGLKGPYSDTYGEVSTCFYYNDFLEKLTSIDEFKSYVRYVDLKGQFDSEYNMPYHEVLVNKYSSIYERIGTNGVHPSEAGYLQIGNAFYRALVSDINRNNRGQ